MLVGAFRFGTELGIPSLPFIMKEISIVGTYLGSAPFQVAIPRLIDHYLRGVLKLEPLVSQRIRLEDINTAYAQLAAGEVARSVITFDS